MRIREPHELPVGWRLRVLATMCWCVIASGWLALACVIIQ